MLTINDIRVIKLDSAKYQAHRKMPVPAYVKKELTGQFAAIGEAAIGTILGITPELFSMQLEAARGFGVSYVMEDRSKRVIGVSAATSLVKPGDLLAKNMILPKDVLRINPALDAHYVLAVFLNDVRTANGMLADDTIRDLSVVGWIDTRDVNRLKSDMPPPTFSTKLATTCVPCSSLRPLDQLLDLLSPVDPYNV